MSQVKIVRGRWLIADAEQCLEDAALAIEGDHIAALGTWPDIKARYPGASVFGSERYAVMPGLINAHHHANAATQILQGVADDVLEPWILANAAMRHQPPRLRAMVSAGQLLTSGVTTVLDVANGGGTAESMDRRLRERLDGYAASGMRVVLAPGITFESFLISGKGEDAAFLSSLPEDLRRRTEAMRSTAAEMRPEDYLAVLDGLIADYRDHPRLSIWYGPPGPQWITDDLMVRIAEGAERHDVGLQTHVLESYYEKLIGPRFYGKPMVRHLKDLGVLSPRFSMAHGVWMSEEDIEIVAETGASVSHNPSSNLRLRAGVAPLNALLKAGVTVGLGMDGTAINDDEDMFAEMRLALRLNRPPRLGDPAPGVEDIFSLATVGGAKLLLQEASLGRLAEGYKADVVLVDLERVCWPWVAPEARPLDLVLQRARAGDVATVLVDGEVVVQEGKPVSFDHFAAGAALAEALEASPSTEAERALTEELIPHLTAWYQAWEAPEDRPYHSFNSRV